MLFSFLRMPEVRPDPPRMFDATTLYSLPVTVPLEEELEPVWEEKADSAESTKLPGSWSGPGWRRILAADEFEGLFTLLETAIELRFLDGMQNLLEERAGLEAHAFEVVTGDEPFRTNLFRGCFAEEALNEVVSIEVAVA